MSQSPTISLTESVSEPLVIYGTVENIATIQLNNPSRRNALSSEVMASLKDLLAQDSR